eukprot:2754556-Prymnesium_polylepis.1
MTRVEHSCLSAPALSREPHNRTAQRAHAIDSNPRQLAIQGAECDTHSHRRQMANPRRDS